MPENRPSARPLSASRERRQIERRSSLTTDVTLFPQNNARRANNKIYSAIDLRTPQQKIEDLEKEIRESRNDSNSEEHLDQLVLMQVYRNLKHGDISVENARAYVNLSTFYFHRKRNFLPQAKFHALSARQILEQLKIKPSDDNLINNRLACDIYLLLIQCSLQAKRDAKVTKNKHILAIDQTHIDHDIKLTEKYLEKLKQSMNANEYDQLNMKFLLLKFDAVVGHFKERYSAMEHLMYELTDYIQRYDRHDPGKRLVDLYLRCGSYLIGYDEKISDGLRYFKKAVDLAEQEEERCPSPAHKHQLARAVLERAMANVRTDHLTGEQEKEFQRAMQLYKQPTNEMNKNMLKVIDELAVYYTKVGKYQDALNVLCESLPDKVQVFGEFSEEVIQTESRIGAIYLREGECLNAAEHLKACLDLQEFVYGPNDSRTTQTRSSVEFLKKDPMVSRTFFARTEDGKRQDRPAFRTTNRISHEKQDLQLLQAVTRKPPVNPKA